MQLPDGPAHPGRGVDPPRHRPHRCAATAGRSRSAPRRTSVHSWIGHLGTKSFTICAEVRDGDTVLAEATVVMVTFDKETQRPAADGRDPARPARGRAAARGRASALAEVLHGVDHELGGVGDVVPELRVLLGGQVGLVERRPEVGEPVLGPPSGSPRTERAASAAAGGRAARSRSWDRPSTARGTSRSGPPPGRGPARGRAGAAPRRSRPLRRTASRSRGSSGCRRSRRRRCSPRHCADRPAQRSAVR